MLCFQQCHHLYQQRRHRFRQQYQYLQFHSRRCAQRQRLFASVKLASAIDPALVEGDGQVVRELIPEVPGASDIDGPLGTR